MHTKTKSPNHKSHGPNFAYRSDIDGLRAIAVLSVVAFHVAPAWVRGGFIGVDVFFVISGFLISTIIFEGLTTGNFSFKNFYARRIKRIFPALFLVLLTSFCIGWFILLPVEFKQLDKHILGGAGFVSNFTLLFESGYFDDAAVLKPLLHLWSLGIEEQFYIIWPLLLWVVWKFKSNWLLVILLLVFVSLGLNVGMIGAGTATVFYAPHSRFWELLIGSALAYLTLFKKESITKFYQDLGAFFSRASHAQTLEKLYNFQTLFGAMLIGIGVLLINHERAFPGWWALLPTVGTALIILAGPQAWLNRALLSNRILVWIGLISFPLYLWHWPLLAFARITEGGVPHLRVRILIVLGSIALAWLTYRFIEKPIRFGRSGKFKVLTLTGLMVAVAALGLYGYRQEGFVKRFPALVQEISQFSFDYKKAWRLRSCFLDTDQDSTAFKDCKTETVPGKPSLLLWGDSHAAQLYPGVESELGKKYNIIQRNTSGCPPILDWTPSHQYSPHCHKNNDAVYELIVREKPERIILAGLWTYYNWETVQKIEITINKLRKIGITDIDLVGPVPQWIDSLPRQLLLYSRSDKHHRIPERMAFGLNQNFVSSDALLSDFSRKISVRYIAPKGIMCNDSGCITMLGQSGDTLTTVDYGHLTALASRFLVSKFPK